MNRSQRGEAAPRSFYIPGVEMAALPPASGGEACLADADFLHSSRGYASENIAEEKNRKFHTCSVMYGVFTISTDTPALYFTVVTKDRLPVFGRDQIKDILCRALNEARQSAGFLIFGYVVMPDHYHLLTDNSVKPTEVMRFANGISSRRVIDYLKTGGFSSSLTKLGHRERARGYRYSLWQHHPNEKLIYTESAFLQRLNYIHCNPVKAGLADQAEQYLWSSIRWWKKRPSGNEPVLVDADQIRFRRG